MSAVQVGTTPVKVAGAGDAPSVQNLGPGTIYLDVRSDVTIETGTKVAVDAYWECPRDLTQDLYAVSSAADTDVRVLMVG